MAIFMVVNSTFLASFDSNANLRQSFSTLLSETYIIHRDYVHKAN